MTDQGGEAGSATQRHRSRLYDYMDLPRGDQRGTNRPQISEGTALPEHAATSPDVPDMVERARREFAVLLGVFRRTAVLVRVDDESGSPLTGDYGGVRWIYAFSNERTLARFALARGEGDREWSYQRWLGARLLDAAVPAAGVPCGVALDVGDEGEGTLFPPVRGVVPERVAVDVVAETGDGN
ncbi:hypothetical protein [Streptomyces sp. NPDC096032]|uniref:hypothetical protein n=1 Tax=Streptomyces sp. NPDC096032 TaxID=3366070 RepID=UPI0037FEB4D7